MRIIAQYDHTHTDVHLLEYRSLADVLPLFRIDRKRSIHSSRGGVGDFRVNPAATHVVSCACSGSADLSNAALE